MRYNNNSIIINDIVLDHSIIFKTIIIIILLLLLLHQREFTIDNHTYHLNMEVTKGLITQFVLCDSNLSPVWAEACKQVIDKPINPNTFALAFAETALSSPQHHLHFF